MTLLQILEAGSQTFRYEKNFIIIFNNFINFNRLHDGARGQINSS